MDTIGLPQKKGLITVPKKLSQTSSAQYALTPDFFAQARDRLAKRLADLSENHRQLLQDIQALEAEVDQLDTDEKLAGDLVARYSGGSSPAAPAKPAKARKATPSRPVPSGPRWTPEDDARVIASNPDQDEALAQRLARSTASIGKRRRVLAAREKASGLLISELIARGEKPPVLSPETTAAEAVDQPPSADANTPAQPVENAADHREETHLAEEPDRPTRHSPFNTRSWAGPQPVAPKPHDRNREAEIAAIAQAEAEGKVKKCPSPGSPELAALPMTQWDNRKHKWVRPESATSSREENQE